MRRLWAERIVPAPAGEVWRLLTDPAAWPRWGPTVRHAEADAAEIGPGVRGVVSTVGGVRLPFEITGFETGRRWSWRVAGVAATDHVVEPISQGSCRVAFGVPWPAAPYLAVCHVALARLERMAVGGAGG